MINVIVAEDKHPILRNVVKKINAYSPNIQVIGEATDGLSALEMCLKLKPDIVFTDIRMPGMDGLQLITELKKTAPNTLFIIISGFNDFEYAREAMRLGVTEFLLKPVTQQAIDEILEKVGSLVDSNHRAQEQQLFSDLLRGRHSPALSKYESPADTTYFIAVICAGSISRFLIELSNPTCDFWLKTDLTGFLANHANGQFEDYWVFDGESMNEMIVVFSSSQRNFIDFSALYEAFLNNFGRSNQRFTFAVSKRMEKLSELRLEYQLSRIILDKNAVFGQSSLLFVKDFSLNAKPNLEVKQAFDKQKLISLIKNKKKDSFLNEIQTIFAQWEQHNFTQSAVELHLSQILYDASHSCLDSPIVTSDLKLELDEVISISKDYPSLYKNVTFIFDNFFNSSKGQEPLSGNVKLIIDKVDSYFRDHLSEEIAIADVAEMVNFNVSFLSREFKKHKGSAPIEYLTHLRIEKAKLLIMDSSNIKFKDIAAMVGYSNQYYFSKVFKLITGLTPTEYKSAALIAP